MKKIGLLTTLLVGSLLLTGCNNQQYEEEFSEYGLLQWPNGTITLEDFEKEGNIINESEVDNWTGGKICSETPETACVPVILKENEILVTPHEYNEFIAEETDLTLLEPYYTDLKTFRKVTGLKEASPKYVEGELPGTYIFDAYTKFYKTKDEREAMLKEKLENQIIEEPVIEEVNIPSFEELEDVVAMCPYEVMGGGYSEYPVYKREFIIPYKDGYIGYNYGGNGGGWGYYLTYKSLDKPCEIISYTDEFFYRHVHYKHDLEEYNEYEYPDNKVYLSQGGMSGIPMDIVEKELNCESGKDMNEDDICKKEVDQFMYNLILGKEENETFTEWMDILKKSIDNTDYYTGSIWFNRWENCNKEFSWESLMKEYGEDTKNLSEEKRREYRKIQINRIHNCLENLNK